MTGIDGGVGGQLGKDIVEAGHKLGPRALGQVGSAYAHSEQGVAGEGHTLLGTIESDATGGMTWGVEHSQLVVAEGNRVAIAEQTTQRGLGEGIVDAKHIAGLPHQIGGQELIGSMYLGLQTKLGLKGVVAKEVIQVAVGTEHMDQLQVMVAQVGHNGLALFGITRAAVDDDGLQAAGTMENVGVLLQHIETESLEDDHKGR